MIATGGMLPRGADAVAPIEVTDPTGRSALRPGAAPRVPGAAVSFAGTDMGRGETVLFSGTRLTSRETGVLAAIGRDTCRSCAAPSRDPVDGRRDRAAGRGDAPGLVYDSNGRILADAVRELGGEPVFLGAFRDDCALCARLVAALAESDVVLLSGGTSKGEGDLNAHRRRRTRARHSGARRRAQAGQADLSGRRGHEAGRDPAGLSDFRDLYVSRIRRAVDSRPGGPAERGARNVDRHGSR